MVQALEYDEILHLLRPSNRMPFQVRALIAFQYVSAARIGELLKYNHKLVHPNETKKEKEYFKKYPERANKERRYIYKESDGLLKSKIYRGKNKISWKMPNFKTKNKSKQSKEPFVLREEKLLWTIITLWLKNCGEQVIDLKESRARQLIRRYLKSKSSHILRKSRGTHLANIFNYTSYDIRDALGHVSLETGIHYISTANRETKMRKILIQMNKKQDAPSKAECMNSFQEFLKEEKSYLKKQAKNLIVSKMELGIKFNEQQRFTLALGEWALKRAIEYNKKPHPEHVGKMKLLIEQASACLGKKEASKRLEGLKK